jgi:type IV pilus assembly protein PilY1
VPTPQVSFANGDDFATNVDSHNGATPRRFYAVQPGSTGQAHDSSVTIRPYVSSSPIDGLGNYGGAQYGPAISNILSSVTYDAVGITPWATNNSYAGNPQCANISNTSHLTLGDCEALAFNFLFGAQSTPTLRTNPAAPSPSLGPDGNGFMPFMSRYCTAGCTTGGQDRSAIGDIFHATPTIVGPPGSLIRDEAYQQFTAANATANTYGNVKQRRTIVYSPTNDGILHAFWADVATQENNELFAFVPPAVMPSLLAQYPSAHQLLLDGAVVTKDVVFSQTAVRSATDLATATSAWHTMLVGSYGTQGRGYYAVDVTNPDPNATPAGAPVFRWQMTTMGTGNANIFGVHSGTPQITTVFADLTGAGSAASAKEYGVAVLPGGQDISGPTGGPCARSATTTGANTSTPSSGFTGRSNVRCWGANAAAADPVVGRSLAIVSLETGEILRVFMRQADLPTTHPLRASGRVIDTPLDSPMTGIPAVYPPDVGSTAQKIFMADADGTIWRFDLTDVNPSNWKGEMFLDAYNGDVDTSTTSWQDAQPIQVPIVTSLDPLGSVVLNFATGDQESYSTSGLNFIYSVSEKVQGSTAFKLRAQVNWYQPLKNNLTVSCDTTHNLVNGERVTGPMSVFDGTLYLATFQPAATASCSVGAPFIWGVDYITASTPGTPGSGPAPKLNNRTLQTVDPTGGNQNSPYYNHLIPGVSIQAQPACATAGSGTDQYVAGATHVSTSNVTAGGYQLMAQVGTKGTTGNTAVQTFTLNLPTPQTATVIDSWAAVIE